MTSSKPGINNPQLRQQQGQMFAPAVYQPYVYQPYVYGAYACWQWWGEPPVLEAPPVLTLLAAAEAGAATSEGEDRIKQIGMVVAFKDTHVLFVEHETTKGVKKLRLPSWNRTVSSIEPDKDFLRKKWAEMAG